MCPDQGNLSIIGGTMDSTAMDLGCRPRIKQPCSAASPKSTFIAFVVLPRVADNPQIRMPRFRDRKRASASSIRTPRLEPISSCHSSATISRRLLNFSRVPGYESNSVRLSGVVTRVVGKRFF